MNRPHLIALVFASLTLALTASAIDAEAKLQRAVEEVLNVANRATDRESLVRSVNPVLRKHISFETMTRRAVGVGWRQFTPAQQKKATDLFTTLVLRTYTNKFTPGEKPNIQYKKAVSPEAGRVDIPTTLVYKGSKYSVSYRLEEPSGWLITDVTIEGVSLIANYRSQLDAAYKKGGAETVLRSLEQSVLSSK